MAPDGSHVRLLMRNAAEPAAAPNGLRIAFVRGYAIWQMRRDGTGQRQLTKPDVSKARVGRAMEDSSPAWSADGTRVYFARWVRETYTSSIFSIRPDGSGLRRLTTARDVTSHGRCHVTPAPSPDGRLVVYGDVLDCDHYTPSSLAAVTVAGRPDTLPFKTSYNDEYNPAWAPNGRWLAYDVFEFDWEAPERVGASGIWVSSSDDASPRRIVRGHDVGWAAWSPDGGWIAYSDQSRGIKTRLVRSDGSQARTLTRNGGDAVWLPLNR